MEELPITIPLIYNLSIMFKLFMMNLLLLLLMRTFFYIESINSSMHHDKNISGDGYIVDFINDATESYYERGKHGYMHLNNIKFPLFMFKFLKFHLFFLPMLATLCFIDLFFYKIPLHRK